VRRLGRGRRGPGLLGTMARTAVIAGTATAVSGKVAAAQGVALAPPVAQAPPQGVDEMLDRLTRLGELRAAGILTEEEFATQKARIVGA
jgi:hypothetical protein